MTPLRTIISAALLSLAGALAAAPTASAAPAERATAHVRAKRHVAAVVAAAPHRRRILRSPAIARIEPIHASFGQLYGLHETTDALALKSSVALVLDQDTNEVLFSKNSNAVLPIASLTKLMTALIVTEANLPLDETLTITQDDVDTEKHSGSRLRVGTQLSREEMLHLALMSSENRAAHALGRTWPTGITSFVDAMNHKAQELGMHDTRYVEPTGLSSNNQSSAHDLATLVKAAHTHQLIREFSTSPGYSVAVGNRQMQFTSTNGLVRSRSWDIGLQKTGYISEAGRCLVMQAKLAGRKLIMVFLDSSGKYSRIADAERVRKWMETTPATVLPSVLPAVLPAGVPVVAPLATKVTL